MKVFREMRRIILNEKDAEAREGRRRIMNKKEFM